MAIASDSTRKSWPQAGHCAEKPSKPDLIYFKSRKDVKKTYLLIHLYIYLISLFTPKGLDTNKKPLNQMLRREWEEHAGKPVTEGWFRTESVWRTRGAESQLRGATCQLYSQAAKEEANWTDCLPARTVERGRQLLLSGSVRTSRDCLTRTLSKAIALPKAVLSMGDTDALRWPLSHVTDRTDSTRALPAIINRF